MTRWIWAVWILLFAVSYAEAEEAKLYAPFLSYAYSVDKPDQDSIIDYSDRIFAIIDNSIVLTNFRFSQVYSNILYSPTVTVERRPFYEEMKERTEAARRISGQNIKIDEGITKITSLASLTRLGVLDQECSSKSFPEKPDGRVRIFDYVLDVKCLATLGGDVGADLITYLRDSLIANDLEVNAARQLFLASYDQTSPAFAVSHDILLRGKATEFGENSKNISIRHITFTRGWLDKTLLMSHADDRYAMYRNQLVFSAQRSVEEPKNYCYIEAINIICNKAASGEHCVIESASCQPIPDYLVLGDFR
ncbi:hypothetical protein [Mesorhizobium sp. M7A.F.Ca.US.008.03.1.1]|uniref:hypothetical protein n=1 Tax=Mesorhizobium sp. M7A.F.Ca.US.008.03.1.1 TaxID=2496742 RepID=UPI000FCBA5EB|nr:hypothetical protein [Mesorhizobium sp. M7A.F.Ca.US.008.03.1.1]RUW61859.1 hypothetical protein EOA16_10515 [Mesorhizobium sp. M7A.F.Ca.US.008.03.1.1]